MEEVGKVKNPYKGFFVSLLMLILVPVVITVLFYIVLSKNPRVSYQLNIYMIHALSFTAASLFDLILILAGFLKSGFEGVKIRLSEFFQGIFLYPRQTIEIYKDNLKEYGITFWIYLPIILFTIAFAIINWINFFQNYIPTH